MTTDPTRPAIEVEGKGENPLAKLTEGETILINGMPFRVTSTYLGGPDDAVEFSINFEDVPPAPFVPSA